MISFFRFMDRYNILNEFVSLFICFGFFGNVDELGW